MLGVLMKNLGVLEIQYTSFGIFKVLICIQ